MEQLEIKAYSEKSFAVFGDSSSIKEKFKKDNAYFGKFNKFLTYTTEPETVKKAGWIFSNKYLDTVQEIINNYNSSINPVVTAESLFYTEDEITTVEEQEPLF